MERMNGPPPYRFPGMDPWLESLNFWSDIHPALIVYMAHELSQQIRPAYSARTERRVVLEEVPRQRVPDVAVLETGEGRGGAARAAVAVAEPLVVQLALEPARQSFIKICDLRSGNRVVTVIEVLSPTNKEPGQDAREKYLAKQEEVLASDVHLVEIDLLRGGAHAVAVPRGLIPESAYRVVIRRANRRDRAEVYPIGLRQRLPRIRIPLNPEDPDAAADLQALLERVYREGALGDVVDYSRTPEPPLAEGDQGWAREILARARDQAESR